MWISRRKWEKLNSRIRTCEEEICKYKKDTEILVRKTAKRILEQPNELHEEILSVENIDKFIENFTYEK